MKKLTTFLFLSLFTWQALAQDAQFSQYFSNPIYLNPAFAGYEGCPRISTSYRIQNPAIDNRFHTVNVSYDQQVGKRHGLYVNYQYDNAAEIITTQELSIGYAPAFWVADKQVMLSPALEIGWRNRFLNSSNITMENIDDQLYNIGYEHYGGPLLVEDRTRNFIDFSLGTLVTFKGLIAGVAIHHLTQPDEQFYSGGGLPLKITTHASYVFGVNENFRIAPAFIYRYQYFSNVLPSVSFEFYGARLGLGFRTVEFNKKNSQFLFLTGYQGNRIKVGYSYDLSVSQFNDDKTGGSHELSIGYVFGCKKSEQRKGVKQISF